MNSLSLLRPFISFHLRSLPRLVYFFAGFLLFFAFLHEIFDFFYPTPSSSIDSLLALYMAPLCGVFSVGHQLFSAKSLEEMEEKSIFPIPHSEFILTRPVWRSWAYWISTVTFFAFVLLPFALNTGFHWLFLPDLKIAVHAKPQEALLYGKEFSDTYLINAKTLVIPHGCLLITGWNFWLYATAAIATQASFLLTSFPKGKPVTIWVGVALAGLMFILFSNCKLFFFFFVHHWIAFLLATAIVIALVQRLACFRIKNGF